MREGDTVGRTSDIIRQLKFGNMFGYNFKFGQFSMPRCFCLLMSVDFSTINTSDVMCVCCILFLLFFICKEDDHNYNYN